MFSTMVCPPPMPLELPSGARCPRFLSLELPLVPLFYASFTPGHNRQVRLRVETIFEYCAFGLENCLSDKMYISAKGGRKSFGEWRSKFVAMETVGRKGKTWVFPSRSLTKVWEGLSERFIPGSPRPYFSSWVRGGCPVGSFAIGHLRPDQGVVSWACPVQEKLCVKKKLWRQVLLDHFATSMSVAWHGS